MTREDCNAGGIRPLDAIHARLKTGPDAFNGMGSGLTLRRPERVPI